MKRVLIILCCICLIICLAAPALAATYFWQDYVVSTEPGFDYDTYDVFIPSSAISCGWSGTGNNDDSFSAHVSYTVPADKLYVNLTLDVCKGKDYLSLEGIDLQSTLNLYIDANKLNATKGYYYCRYECVDSDGDTITTIQDNSANFDSSFGEIKIDLTSLPEGTVGIRPRLLVQYTNLIAGETYELNFVGLSFDVLQPPSMTGSYEFMQLQNYIVNESSDGDTSKLYCSIPFSDFNTVTWYKLQGEDQQRVQSGMGQSFTTVLEEDPYGWWIDCSPFSGRQYIDITDVVNGSTFSVSFDITYEEEYPQQLPGMSGRYQVRYYDKDFNLIGDVQFFDMEEVYWDMNELSFTIDKPENAVGMSFILQFTNVNSLSYPNPITLDFHSVDLVCDIPTMVRVQQETGRTNKLLEKIMDGWEPAPTLPPFNDSMQDSLDKEDQIIDQLDPDGVMSDLDAIQVTVLDRILLLANSFQMISLMFQAFLKVPVLEIIAYVSLLFGLLASLLGIGIAAGRAASRHEGRSGKKGK